MKSLRNNDFTISVDVISHTYIVTNSRLVRDQSINNATIQMQANVTCTHNGSKWCRIKHLLVISFLQDDLK